MHMADKRKDKSGRVLRKGESQRKDNTYMYRWVNNDGERECVYARTLNELRELEEGINRDMVLGVCRKADTLNEQIERYLKTKVNLANSTKENYKYYFNHVIKESRIGRTKVTDIRKSDILLFYNSLTEQGLSIGTIKIIHKIIRPSLQLACDDDVISKNPADGCTKDYTDNPEKKYALTFEEEEEFLTRIVMRPRMKRYYPMYAIILKTGMRISEAIGLTWNDVSLDSREISINHQIQYRVMDGVVKLYSTDTKTSAGRRVIPMTDEVYQLFMEQRKVWLSTKKDPDFNVDGYKDFVFVSHITGKCMNHNSVRRMMRTIVSMNDDRDIKLPDLSPHILRHTACCRFAESGCDIKVLQYLMGQTDIKTTMRVYNHVDMERVKRELNRLKQLNQQSEKFTPKFTPFCHKFM
ncbi:tyrosine-type recombinase/integrase [Lachnospiraceae bacterium MD335]|nr:tyrosine-type recombinase/integrase [Lachnospiraceae bacterium MD335]